MLWPIPFLIRTIKGGTEKAMNVTVTNEENEAVPVKLTGSNVEEPIHINDIGVEYFQETATSSMPGVESLTWETVFETTKPVIIDYLEWSTNSETNSRLAFNPRMTYASRNLGSGYATFSPENLRSAGFPFFDVVMYDTEENLYRFMWKDKIIRPNGIKIERGTVSPDPIWNNVRVYGRYLKP